MSVSELVISGYLLGDVCEFFIKKNYGGRLPI